MVHALQQIHRVLIPDGFLIDLRPFIATSPVDIVSGDEVLAAGVIDNSAGFPDDLAANDAIEHILETGLFRREERDDFDFYTYWNALADFVDYMENRSTAFLPAETRNQLEMLLPQYGRDARIRRQQNMIIARYRKTSPI